MFKNIDFKSRNFLSLILVLVSLFVLVLGSLFYFKIKNVDEKSLVPMKNKSNPISTNKINSLIRNTPIGVSEQRKKDFLEAYSLAWDMYDGEDSEPDQKLTGAIYTYFIYLESCNIDSWFLDAATLNNNRSLLHASTTSSSTRVLADMVMIDMLLDANENKPDRYAKVLASYLMVRELNKYINSDGSTTTIPTEYRSAAEIAKGLLLESPKTKTQFRGARFFTNMIREEFRTKLLLSMFGMWDSSNIDEEYKKAIEEIISLRRSLLETGDIKKEVSYAYNNEVGLRISYASYKWIMQKEKVIGQDIIDILNPLYTQEYKENSTGIFYGIFMSQSRKSYTKNALIEIAKMNKDFGAFLKSLGWDI